MTAEQISLLAISVALLSALVAAWSLREAKEARVENRTIKINFRKTDLLASLTDTTNKGYQLLYEIHECFENIAEKSIKNNEGIKQDIDFLVKKKNDVSEKIKGFDDLKQEFIKDKSYDSHEIEANISVSYAQFKAWENDIELTKKALRKIKKITPPSVYEERGIISV